MTDNQPLGESSNLEQLALLQPGDLVEIWMEHSYLVSTVYRCRERLDGLVTEWRWIFLDDGSLIETSPDGYYLYRDHVMIKQGTPLYEEMAARDGALVRFEGRVQDGTVGRSPVHITIEEKEYRVASTGTLEFSKDGPGPALIPWQQLSTDPGANVYFGMVGVEDEDEVVLGLWVSHISLSFGKPLRPEQIANVFRNQPKGR
ncbi:MAG: hypothetical protein EXR51_02070 [Dehalococcoidia bacterium]|nr:hypothetical protein [Dehalococcoidia bacterium]